MKDDKILMLSSRDGRKFIVRANEGMKEIGGLGVVDTDRLSESLSTAAICISGKDFILAEASLLDLISSIKRGPQIIMSKDSAQIVMGCAIGPGKKVLEVGTGSASLTIALAYFVGAEGHVLTYEMNPKHAELAKKNIVQAGMGDIVEMREENAASCSAIQEFHAVVMDMPEPWKILENMTGALKVGGYLCAYLPTMNQVETTVKAMREFDYAETHVLENIQREIVVGPGGTRPSFEMLGHTGYLCFGRKIKP